MAGDRPSQSPRGDDGGSDPGPGQGYTAISYLIGGIVVWGGIGWLIDAWLHTGRIAIAIGAVLGAAGGIYLVVRRLGGM